MANPDTLNDERSLADAEAALAREEQALAQRQDAAAGGGVTSKAKALLARVDALEKSGAASPDLTRAKGVVTAALAADGTSGQAERAAALAARRAALKAREAAVQAVSAGLAQLETDRAKHQKRLDAVETFIAGTEAVLGQMKDQQRKADQDAASKAAADAIAAKAAKEAEAKAAKDAEAAKAAAPSPVPEAIALKPKAKAPAPVVVAEPPPPVAKAPPAKAPPTRPAPVAAATSPGTKHVSRRRRVRLAPPPKKLEVEVAVFGENNFYTSFDNHIGTGGLFVASHETLPTGHELDLDIDLEGKRIAARGRVEFSRIDNPISVDCTPGAGVKLLNLSGGDATAIEAFFSKRSPMFYAAVQ